MRQRTTRYSSSPANAGIYSHKKQYQSGGEGSGIRRHEVSYTPTGTPGALLPNEYLHTALAQFARSFTAADDGEPTATASNNFQTSQVMNGSRISNMKCVVNIANQSASQGAYVDVYMVACSFWDILVWDTIQTAYCPYTFDSTTTGPPDIRGAITAKAITAAIVLDNIYKSFKFIQRYMKKVGRVYVSASDGGKAEAQLVITDIPAKCRRSQTGMFYGLILHNDSTANNAATLNLDVTVDLSFIEHPTSNRLPFIT